MPFLFVILALLLLFSIFLFVPLQFGVHFHKTATKQKIYVYVSLFGILIRIPIHTKKDDKKPKRKEKKKKVSPPNERALSFETFRKNIDAFGELIEVSKNELLDMLSYVRKNLTCKELDFRIAFGMDDAAKTGIATGAVWASGTFLLKLIDTLISIKKVHMDVYPDFNHKRFEISFKTILIMQPIHFIIIYRRIRETTTFIQTKISNLK